jgi:galactokinase
MTGGGFGGCTLNFVDTLFVEEFVRQIAVRYKEAVGIAPEIYVCDPANGARGRAVHPPA